MLEKKNAEKFSFSLHTVIVCFINHWSVIWFRRTRSIHDVKIMELWNWMLQLGANHNFLIDRIFTIARCIHSESHCHCRSHAGKCERIWNFIIQYRFSCMRISGIEIYAIAKRCIGLPFHNVFVRCDWHTVWTIHYLLCSWNKRKNVWTDNGFA